MVDSSALEPSPSAKAGGGQTRVCMKTVPTGTALRRLAKSLCFCLLPGTPSYAWATSTAHSLVSKAQFSTDTTSGLKVDRLRMGAQTVEPGKTRIGWIGTGIMGRWMAQHCMDAGYSATVSSRTLSKCDPLKEKGASVVSTPKEVAAASDVVFLIVGYPSDVREVVLGPEGVLTGLKPGGIVVDMTTSEPSLAREVYEAAKARGVHAVDAPVSGGDVGARNAALSIMVGGDADVVESIRPLFDAMGKNVRHMGPAGSGQHTKMTNQILIASTMVGVVEGLLYAQRAGLDLEQVIAAVGAGAAGSFSINNLGPRIVARNFDPGFITDHFIKDLGIALEESRRMNLSMPGLALANQLYLALKAQGHGRLGTHALMLALEQLNGIRNGDK